jgi:hypothetical protein
VQNAVPTATNFLWSLRTRGVSSLGKGLTVLEWHNGPTILHRIGLFWNRWEVD